MRHWLLPLLFAPLLTACVNDGASYEISGAEHSLSLIREQPLFWDKTVNLSLAVARMPECLRRHSIGPGTANTKVEIYRVPSGAFIVRAGKRMYATETQTCEGWAKMDGEPDGVEITLIGTFRVKNDKLVFVKEDDEEKKRK